MKTKKTVWFNAITGHIGIFHDYGIEGENNFELDYCMGPVNGNPFMWSDFWFEIGAFD